MAIRKTYKDDKKSIAADFGVNSRLPFKARTNGHAYRHS